MPPPGRPKTQRVWTYYDELGLPFGASEQLIKQRYRELAKQFHPDINPSPEAQAQMQRINEAYRVLTTPHLRIAYHLRLLAWAARQSVATASSPPHTTPVPMELPRSSFSSPLLAILIGFIFLIAVIYHWLHPFPFQRLILQNLNLRHIPPYLHLPSSLQKIDLSYNSFTTLPVEIKDVSGLIVLDLSHNRLSEFPLQVLELPRLEELNLAHNAIYALPLGIGEMHSLRRLDLRHNHLRQLPTELFLLPRLEYLDLRGNPLSPDTKAQLHRLSAEVSYTILWDK